jgi:TPR repeat protein
MNIAIFIAGFSLLAIFTWMAMLSSKKKKMAEKKAERERAYRKAIQRQQEEERKERIFKADTGHVPTQLYLAKEAERSNPAEALHWYERAALLGSEVAMYGVVRVCGRAKDDIILKEKAKFWQLCIDATEGDKKAQFKMGKAFIAGTGIEQDIDKGLKAIEELAEADITEAQVFMGDWYVAESNLNPNHKLSAEWHFRAAMAGSSEGQLKLGHHYRDGSGVPQNHTRASYWYERGGEQGNAEAQYHAGEIWVGMGEKGNAIAYIWLFLSAHFGYEEARHRRDDVGNLLGVDSIVGLQAMLKPLIRKMDIGALDKHSLIKALNKLYKRETYFPDVDGNEFMLLEKTEEEHGEEQEEELFREPEVKSPPEHLDFSHSPMDRHQP